MDKREMELCNSTVNNTQGNIVNDQMTQHYIAHGNNTNNSLKNMCIYGEMYTTICNKATQMINDYNWKQERLNIGQLKQIIYATILHILAKAVCANEISSNVSTNVLAEFCRNYRYDKNGNLISFKKFLYV